MMDKIEAFEMWIWRRCLKISYTEHKTNSEVLEQVGESRKLKKEIIKKKLQDFGHFIRKDGIQKRLLDAEVEGKKGRGRPMTSWMGNITKWTGKRYEQLCAEAEDRSCWRRVISNALAELDTSR